MIITCRRCSTKFRLDDALVSPLAKAKCTFCGNIFVMADGMESADFQTAIDAREKAAPEKILSEAESSKKAVEAILNKDGDLYDVDGQKKKRRKPKAVVLAVGIVLLLLAVGGGVYALDPFGWRLPQAGGDAPVAGNASTQSASAPVVPTSERSITDLEELKNITLLDVKQYFVNNDKLGGRLFVIEGSVVNNFPTPVDLIRVEASLMDADKNIIVSNQQFCGISVSYFQLQVLTEKELTEALSNKLEVLSKNMNVQPGSKVPFIFVFRSVPSTVRAFGVKVIEAQRPEKKDSSEKEAQ